MRDPLEGASRQEKLLCLLALAVGWLVLVALTVGPEIIGLV